MEKDPIRTKIGSFCIWINDVLNTFSKNFWLKQRCQYDCRKTN